MNKRMTMLAALWMGGLMAGQAHADMATTIKAVPLQAAAQSDSATLATLEQNARVEVLGRKGAWNQVKATGHTGWVRMMSLRLETAPGTPASSAPANPLGALTGLLSSGRTENSATVTTGVRGLSEEDLQKAEANQKELEKMKKFGVDKKAGQAFAKRSKLAPAKMDYLPEPQPAATPEPDYSQAGG
jgi:hypothetical protein